MILSLVFLMFVGFGAISPAYLWTLFMTGIIDLVMFAIWVEANK